MSGNFHCEACGAPADQLLQRNTDGQFVCFSCVPDSDWETYPGSRAREQLREQRAAQARRNFGHAPSSTRQRTKEVPS